MSSQRHASSPQQQNQGIPQSLKLTDYLRPVFQESYLIREYCLFAQIQQQNSPVDANLAASHENLNSTCQAKMLTGLYVIPSAQSHFLWFGLICINNDRGFSPWHGGVLRFFIRFPENYPSALPTITFLPIKPNQNLTTHPDVNAQGTLNLRSYATSSTLQTTQHVPKIYKILRLVRKAFYRQFNDIDVRDSVNPAAAEMIKHDYNEFLRNCSIEASESLKYLGEIDKLVLMKFKNDANCIVLGGGGDEGQSVVNGIEEKQEHRVLGLSFM